MGTIVLYIVVTVLVLFALFCFVAARGSVKRRRVARANHLRMVAEREQAEAWVAEGAGSEPVRHGPSRGDMERCLCGATWYPLVHECGAQRYARVAGHPGPDIWPTPDRSGPPGVWGRSERASRP